MSEFYRSLKERERESCQALKITSDLWDALERKKARCGVIVDGYACLRGCSLETEGASAIALDFLHYFSYRIHEALNIHHRGQAVESVILHEENPMAELDRAAFKH